MSITNILRSFLIHNTKSILRNIHSCKSSRQNIDVIDMFTTQLVEKKGHKWDGIRNKVYRTSRINKMVHKTILNEDLNIMKYNIKQIDDVFNVTLESNDIKKTKIIIDQCITYEVVPSFQIADKIMSFCSQNSTRETIVKFSDLIRKVYPQEYRLNSEFKHYLAESYWLRGNITKAIELFDEVYVCNKYLRKKIKFLIRFLIINIVSQSSEGALVAVIQFTEKLAVIYDDYYLLSIVWQNCFLSNWFSDQCIATILLEKHKKLTDMVEKKIPFILYTSVRENKPEILLRLMEILLKYEMKDSYPRVLQTLFDYKYRINDLKSCAEIVQWSLNLNVNLSSSQHQQFLSLLLGAHELKLKEDEKLFKPTESNFQLKF